MATVVVHTGQHIHGGKKRYPTVHRTGDYMPFGARPASRDIVLFREYHSSRPALGASGVDPRRVLGAW